MASLTLCHKDCNSIQFAGANRSEKGPYRFYFYSHEPGEPPHVHVDRDDLSAKFWISPVALARNFGFSAIELGKIESLVEDYRAEFLEKWNGHFGIES